MARLLTFRDRFFQGAGKAISVSKFPMQRRIAWIAFLSVPQKRYGCFNLARIDEQVR